jgi:molybdenum cofactor guanylyltransferase
VTSVLAAIIAGGQGTRLGGVAKGLLAVGGRRIVDRQLEVLRPLFARVVLVASDPGPWAALGLPIVPDRVPSGAGPLAGIDAALAALAPAEEAVVCVGGDMPFLTADALALLRDHAPAAPAVAARVGGLPEPLFARYARSCAPLVAAALAAGRFKAAALLDDLAVEYLDEPALRAVDPTLRFLTNINTPADLSGAG